MKTTLQKLEILFDNTLDGQMYVDFMYWSPLLSFSTLDSAAPTLAHVAILISPFHSTNTHLLAVGLTVIIYATKIFSHQEARVS